MKRQQTASRCGLVDADLFDSIRTSRQRIKVSAVRDGHDRSAIRVRAEVMMSRRLVDLPSRNEIERERPDSFPERPRIVTVIRHKRNDHDIVWRNLRAVDIGKV